MSENTTKQWYSRAIKRTIKILDEESMEVSRAEGKLATYWDITSHDHVCYKLTRVFYGRVLKKDLEKLLNYNVSPYGRGTEIQLFIYDKNCKKPLARPKLRYNEPGQRIPDELMPFLK